MAFKLVTFHCILMSPQVCQAAAVINTSVTSRLLTDNLHLAESYQLIPMSVEWFRPITISKCHRNAHVSMHSVLALY